MILLSINCLSNKEIICFIYTLTELSEEIFHITPQGVFQ